VLRVRVTTRSHPRRACPARVEAVPTATVRVVRAPQPVQVAPVRVLRVPRLVQVAPVPQLAQVDPVRVARVPRVPVETARLRA
jgi:transcriptional regulator of nitric oxide reductase